MGIPADVVAFVAADDLTKASGWRSTVRTAIAAGVYATAAVVAATVDATAVWVAAWVVQAVVITGSAAALHEATHSNLYRSSKANRIAGVLWAALLLGNFSAYRAFHLHHHVYTATPDDSEPRVTFNRVGHYTLGIVAFGWFFIFELWATSIRAVVGKPPKYVRTSRQRAAIRRDGLVLVASLAGLVAAVQSGNASAVLAYWGIPLLLAVSCGLAVASMPEHYGCDTESRDPLANTRSVTTNALFRFVLWNNNFHAEHHLYPAVPWHNQPKLHEYLAADGRHQHLESSYLAWHLRLANSLRRRARLQRGAAATPLQSN